MSIGSRILDGATEVARHHRCYDRQRFVLDPAHAQALLRNKRKALYATRVGRLVLVVPESEALLERAFAAGRRRLNPFQDGTRGNSDESAIGGPKRKYSTLCPRQWPRRKGIHRANPQLDGSGSVPRCESTGQLDNTVFVFTSDEGYFFGEHGLSIERRLAYEESIRIPLIIRYPKLIRTGSHIDAMALGIDLAPTLLELAGTKPAAPMNGRSLVPLLERRKTAWRKSFLVEYSSDRTMQRMLHMGYQAVRTERWKYIHYTELEGMDELYDLRIDPYEMRNLIAYAAVRGMLESLRADLQRLKQ